jgi:hypothetical protein
VRTDTPLRELEMRPATAAPATTSDVLAAPLKTGAANAFTGVKANDK